MGIFEYVLRESSATPKFNTPAKTSVGSRRKPEVTTFCMYPGVETDMIVSQKKGDIVHEGMSKIVRARVHSSHVGDRTPTVM